MENSIHSLAQAIDTLEHTDSKLYFEIAEASIRMRLTFLLDQLKYLIIDKHARRYNIITQVFCLKIHGIFPACYRLIQGSNCLTFPHERNLLKVKNSIGLEQCYLTGGEFPTSGEWRIIRWGMALLRNIM